MEDTMNGKWYSVWVGGVEVCDYLLTIQDADKLKQLYEEDGYTDVSIGSYRDSYE